jgi:cytidyltransferase-like protein
MSGRFAHGLVIGKFYPPHAGHHRLIDAAAARCDRVSVVVAGHDVETIPYEARAAWVAATHGHQPNVRVIGERDPHPGLRLRPDLGRPRRSPPPPGGLARRVVAGKRIDAVFSSEPYATSCRFRRARPRRSRS